MNRKRIGILVVAAFVAILATPVIVWIWEHRSLASVATFADTSTLLGQPVESFHSAPEIADRFGHWDFHDLVTNETTFTPDLPSVTDRACLYRGRLGILTEYLVYFDGQHVTQAYFVGAN